jgi:YD repeat-containing protein
LGVKKAFGTPIQQDYAKYEYTLNGRQKAVTDANGNRAELTFDGFDRQRHWIFPSNTPGLANAADYEEYGYDIVGNRTSLRKRDGSTLTFQYDALNRVIVKIVPERAGLTAAQTRDVYYSYDVSGLPLKARFDTLDGEGVTQYQQDIGLGRAGTFPLALMLQRLVQPVEAVDPPRHRRLELRRCTGGRNKENRDGIFSAEGSLQRRKMLPSRLSPSAGMRHPRPDHSEADATIPSPAQEYGGQREFRGHKPSFERR